MSSNGWIGVDLDGTIAHYDGWKGEEHIGPPILPMLERVKAWLAEGREVRIFTARVHDGGEDNRARSVEAVRGHIERWCLEHVGVILPITNVKDYGMVELWDDRAVQVNRNTGVRADDIPELERRIVFLEKTVEDLLTLMNTPEVEDFDKGVPLEAAHQVERWGAKHDAGKNPEDWYWLIGYLAGKALACFRSGDLTKSKHHCISAAAALRNWHAHIRTGESAMRPGIGEEKQL